MNEEKKYRKCFASCGTPFSEYFDGTVMACPYIGRISPEAGLENDYPFDDLWGCEDCDGWTLDPDYDGWDEV